MRIGIDLDDVLADSLPHFTQAFNERFGLDIQLADAVWRIADRFPHIPRQEADDFFTELIADGFFSSRPLIPHAKEAVEALAEDGHRLYIVTGRSPQEEPITRRWLIHVEVLSRFEAVMHRTREPVGYYKSSAASELRLDLFIEDELAVAHAVSETTIPVLLFDRPWNQGPLPDNVHRIGSWGEALTRIAALNGSNGHR